MSHGSQAEAVRDERRRHQRLEVDAKVSLTSDSNFYTGFSSNISEGGIFITTYNLAPLGTDVDVTLSLPGTVEPLQVAGKVRWVRDCGPDSEVPPGMGLEFVNLPEAVRAQIQQFVAARGETLFFDE